MRSTSFNLLFAGMAITAIGIAALQIYWLGNAWDLKEEQFSNSVNQAMSSTADRIDQLARVSWIAEVQSEAGTDGVTQVHIISDSISQNLFTTINAEQHFFVSDESEEEIVVVRQRFESSNGAHEGEFVLEEIHAIGNSEEVKINVEERIGEYEEIIVELMRDEIQGTLSTTDFVDSLNVDSILRINLDRQDLRFDFTTLLTDPLTSPTEEEELEIDQDIFEVSLFPNSLANNELKLLLFVANRTNYVLKEMTGLILLSIGLLLVMCLTMLVAVRTILKQKRLAAMKNDFMNNMTHEFKTPLATISLAADSITHPSVVSNSPEVNRFVTIIKDENKRMQRQVERVLELAKLEQNEVVTQFQEIELSDFFHDIEEASNLLLLPHPEGRLNFKVAFTEQTMQLDAFHLRNAIMNVIENAVKYNKPGHPPVIDVHAESTASGLNIVIQDEGIGMDETTRANAFNSFYRASNGDLHNVKGFGIGLSYSKSILEQHHGTIDVKSKLNHGTAVHIHLPIK